MRRKIANRKRKLSDYEIERYNAVGMSLRGIAAIGGCHPTAVSLRLKAIGVLQTDTRYSFMEEIFHAMPDYYHEFIADFLMHPDKGDPKTIKDYIRDLIKADVAIRQTRLAADQAPNFYKFVHPIYGA